MNIYLKLFEFMLWCLGLVFIGFGEKWILKEYYVEGDWVYFLDMEFFYVDILVYKRKFFEVFVMNIDGV